MIIDMHTHAGHANRGGPVDINVLATMGRAGVAAAVVSAIADLPLLRRDPETRRLILTREPVPGECLASVEDYLGSYEQTGLRIAREPDEIRADDPALVLAVEGCDFLDGDLDRLDLMQARGVRSIQLTHYRVNETGDIQTAPEVHLGLTSFGAAAVRRMNRLGIMVDVAHCSEATVRGVLQTTTRPLLCTHANLIEQDHKDGSHPRYISPAYAGMVAETGGVIGGWIAVLHEEKLPGMIRHILRLIDAVGVDHVGIGTDLPSGAQWHGMADFARHQEIPDRLRAAGLSADETAKICGGNWLRVFRAARE
jgi:membrane dipeptidase